MNMTSLERLSSSELAQLLGQKKPAVLVGSGVSLWEPSNLPTGQDFTKGVLNAVFDPSTGVSIVNPTDKLLLDELLDALPFEMLLERCPDQNAIRSILTQLYGAAEPNPIHNALAKMAADGVINSIITTNYDLALDRALGESHANFSRVVLESQEQTAANKIYFKIHGSADNPESLVYSTRLESRLPKWKRRVLSCCIDNRPLLIIGYSGLDFELCPELSKLNPSLIAWNFFSEADTKMPGCTYLATRGKPLKLLIGNMTRLIELLGCPLPMLVRSTDSLDVKRLICKHFCINELLLWQVRLFNSMGFCRLSKDALELLLTDGYLGTDLEYAQTLFQMGLYQQAGKLYLNLSKDNNNERKKVLRLLDASDSFRCYGSFMLSFALIRSAGKIERRKIRDPFVRSRIIMKKLLLFQNLARLLPLGKQIVRKLGVRLVRSGASAALHSGEWLVFQQFMLIAERWGIPMSSFKHVDLFDPPPSKDGYRHLGYRIGELLRLLDSTRQPLSSLSYHEFSSAFRIAVKLGSHPTAWKIAARTAALFPQFRRRYRILHRFHLNQCEYSKLKKWVSRCAK